MEHLLVERCILPISGIEPTRQPPLEKIGNDPGSAYQALAPIP